MALFAGGRCAGMGAGHYVTLDCATHFIARGQIDVPMDAVVRLVGADPGRPRLPVGALRAGRPADAQLHRHAQADPRHSTMTGPVGHGLCRAGRGAASSSPTPTRPRPSPRSTASPPASARRTAASCRACSPSPHRPRGVYLWGGVGRGKSMLMDLAFDSIAAAPKRRTHFAPFMLDVHQRLRAARATEEGDPGHRGGRSSSPTRSSSSPSTR